MTPKEKALDLYKKYEFVYVQNYTSKHEVKECANIAVDEIINADAYSPFIGGYYELLDDRLEEVKKYWEEVKQEINNL